MPGTARRAIHRYLEGLVLNGVQVDVHVLQCTPAVAATASALATARSDANLAGNLERIQPRLHGVDALQDFAAGLRRRRAALLPRKGARSALGRL